MHTHDHTYRELEMKKKAQEIQKNKTSDQVRRSNPVSENVAGKKGDKACAWANAQRIFRGLYQGWLRNVLRYLMYSSHVRPARTAHNRTFNACDG